MSRQGKQQILRKVVLDIISSKLPCK